MISANCWRGGWRIGPISLPPLPYLFPLLLLWALALVLFVVQSDLGSALLFFGIFLAMLYVASGKPFYVVGGLVLFVGGVLSAEQRASPRSSRMFRSGLTYGSTRGRWATYEGYQIVQSLFALASGGVLGKGIGFGAPGYIPAVPTDMIISAIGEELGLAGTLAVIALFMVLVYRGFHIAFGARSGYEQLLAVGLTTVLGLASDHHHGGRHQDDPADRHHAAIHQLRRLVADHQLRNCGHPVTDLIVEALDMIPVVRSAVRFLALVLAVAVLAFGIVSDALPKEQTDTSPPDDSRWLVSLGIGFSVADGVLDTHGVGRSAETRQYAGRALSRQRAPAWGFPAGGVHASQPAPFARADSGSGLYQAGDCGHGLGSCDPGPAQDTGPAPDTPRSYLRRGQSGCGERGDHAHRAMCTGCTLSRTCRTWRGYYNPTVYGTAGLEASFDDYLAGRQALDPLLVQQNLLLNRPPIGDDLYLTINPDLQDVAQKSLGERKGRWCCSMRRRGHTVTGVVAAYRPATTFFQPLRRRLERGKQEDH